MTSDDFRARLKAIDLTIAGFAELTGQHPVTAANWGKPRSARGVQEFPRWVPLLLTLLERERCTVHGPAAAPPAIKPHPTPQVSVLIRFTDRHDYVSGVGVCAWLEQLGFRRTNDFEWEGLLPCNAVEDMRSGLLRRYSGQLEILDDAPRSVLVTGGATPP